MNKSLDMLGKLWGLRLNGGAKRIEQMTPVCKWSPVTTLTGSKRWGVGNGSGTRRWYSSSNDKQEGASAPETEEADGNGDKDEGQPEPEAKEAPTSSGRVVRNRGYDKDRTKVIPVEVSMRYLKSSAYKETYGNNLVWVLYRRNFPGQFAPKKTRKTCIRKGVLTSGNACPICRDEYLVVDYRNVDLLKQFISPFNGEILGYGKTGVCRTQHSKLVVEILKARDVGAITFDVPVREYNYSEYQHLYESYKASSS